jgi:hypothetical protein
LSFIRPNPTEVIVRRIRCTRGFHTSSKTRGDLVKRYDLPLSPSPILPWVSSISRTTFYKIEPSGDKAIRTTPGSPTPSISEVSDKKDYHLATLQLQETVSTSRLPLLLDGMLLPEAKNNTIKGQATISNDLLPRSILKIVPCPQRLN